MTEQGDLFGALLTVRHGRDLNAHVRLMLERLGDRQFSGGGNLRDALAFIAAMHAEDLGFLSRPVLAQALFCPIEKLQKEVLFPLGQEAAATTTSAFVFTRHRRIAEAVVAVLEQEFAKDIGSLFFQLGQAAIDSFMAGKLVPNLAAWRFEFAEHFLAAGKTPLALTIARGVLDREPLNYRTLVDVAHLYRKAGLPEDAVQFFRRFPRSVKSSRGFYFEWAVCEGEVGEHASNALLAAFSLSDDVASVRVDNDTAIRSLAGIGIAFRDLWLSYHEQSFRDARAAACYLGLRLKIDERSNADFRKGLQESIADGAEVGAVKVAFEYFAVGVVAAEAIGTTAEVADLIANAKDVRFGGLNRLISAFDEARVRRSS